MAAAQLSDLHEMVKAWAEQHGEYGVLGLIIRATQVANVTLLAMDEEPNALHKFFRTITGRSPNDADIEYLARRAADREAGHG